MSNTKEKQVETLVQLQMLLQELEGDGLEYLKGMIEVREKMILIEAARAAKGA